jgi:hypothetical protein
MNPIDESEFEPFVREAMQARPQPRSISNLAFRAMELAREQARVLARRQVDAIVRLRRRTMWVGMVATILIAVVVWLGAKKISDTGALGATTSSTATTTSDQSTSDSSSSSSNSVTLSPSLVVTAELLVVAMILLSAGIAWPRAEGPEAMF